MPIACLLVSTLGLACELAGRPEMHSRPTVLGDEAGRRVQEANPAAQHWQVRPGMTLREATAYCPPLAVLEPHPARAAEARQRLVAAMGQVTPLVDDAAPGIVYGDLRGTGLLYRSPGEAAERLLALAPSGLQPRVGVAGHRFTAFVAAHEATPMAYHDITCEDEAAFLAPKPVDWLPLDDESCRWLHLLGIKTLGGLAALPRAKVEAQLGKPGGAAWLAAAGADPTPVRPISGEGETISESAQNEPPLIGRESVLLQAEQLLSRAVRRADHRFVRSLHLQAVTDTGQLWQRTHILKEPAGDRAHLWLIVRTHLNDAEFPGPIETLTLTLRDLTHERGRQPGLFRDHRRQRDHLEQVVRQLKIRYATPVIHHVVEREPWSRIPERRFALADYDP